MLLPRFSDCVRGENPVTPRAQFSFPVAGGQHAAVHDGTPAFRRRRQPVERRPGFKSRTTDQRATRPYLSQGPISVQPRDALATANLRYRRGLAVASGRAHGGAL